MFFFISPRDLRAPSTDYRGKFATRWELTAFYNASPKIRGTLTKNIGAKNIQNFDQFYTTSDVDREYLRNGTRYRKSERHVIDSDSRFL